MQIKGHQYWHGDIGNKMSYELKANPPGYFGKKSININFQDNDIVFVVIELKNLDWDLYQTSDDTFLAQIDRNKVPVDEDLKQLLASGWILKLQKISL